MQRILCLVTVALLCACASGRTPDRPPIPPILQTPTHETRPGKFVWMDLVTDDVDGARQFYGALFGWTFDGDDRYVRVLQAGTPIAGIVPVDRLPDLKRRSEWVSSLSVEDVDTAAARVRAGGGHVETGPVDAPHRGRLALVSDPAGAAVLLLHADGGDPPDERPPVGRWLWRELWTQDVSRAESFYDRLAGYRPETVEIDGHPYRVFKTGDVPRAGIVKAPDDVDPIWLGYVRVADAPALAARAKELGARVVLEGEHAAILVDPTGAAVGLQFWPDEPAP